MKVAITGHTSGLGQHLYNYFKSLGHDVVGISRTTGYDINTDQDKIVLAVQGFDLFINNTHIDNCQTDLLKKLVNNVKLIIVIGSAMHLFRDVCTFDYLEKKFLLSKTCRNLNVDPKVETKILHINVSFVPENKTDQNKLQSDNVVEYDELFDLISYWIKNPIFTDVALKWKLTPLVVNQLKSKIPNLNIDFL